MSKKFTFEEKIIQEINLLNTEEDFRDEIAMLQKKYGFPVAPEDRLENGTPKKMVSIFDPFYADIKTLRTKYLLSEAYQLALGILVQEGHLKGALLQSEYWHLNPYLVPTETENCIKLIIYPETSFDDVKAKWDEIRKIQALMLSSRSAKRKNRRKNLDRDLEILRLYESGIGATEIKKIINQSFKTTKLCYEDVSKIISRLKQRVKTPPPKES